MHDKLLRNVELVVFIIVAIYVSKVLTGYVAMKWPNKITQGVNSVVQGA